MILGGQMQIHIHLPDTMKEPLKEVVWRLRFNSRNAFILAILELFVPRFDVVKFFLFASEHFPNDLDRLIEEINKGTER